MRHSDKGFLLVRFTEVERLNLTVGGTFYQGSRYKEIGEKTVLLDCLLLPFANELLLLLVPLFAHIRTQILVFQHGLKTTDSPRTL